MNRTDQIGAEADPVLLTRLQQATMPGSNSPRQSGQGTATYSHSGTRTNVDPAQTIMPNSGLRLQQTTFTSAFRDPYALTRPEAKKNQGWFRSACAAIWAHAWLILALATIGFFLGYLYTVRLCVPLYRIQASLEVRNSHSVAHTEALAHILQSQSLVNSVLTAMPGVERTALVERSGFPFIGSRNSDEMLHQRLDAIAIPSAQVVDISLVSSNRPAAVDFVNGLIDALIKREQEHQPAAAALPDDWNSLPDRSTLDRTTEDIAIIDPAIASLNPVSPILTDNLFIAVVGGALLGIVIALVRKFAVDTFAGPGSVGEVLGVRELGSIPQRKLLGPAGSDTAHAGVQMDANDESLRYLRSSLLYHPGKQQLRFLAFTSAAPGESKTTIVANLSMSLAATGRRVLVIDGDLRRPRLHKLMQVPAGPGLADLLRRDPAAPPASLSRFVHATSFQNLYVLPPGTAGDDAPELLAGPHLAQLFRELAKSFDFVLIDTPPLLACSDARNYARAVEGVVLVVRSSETQKRAALVARDMLLQDGAIIIRTVLTGWRQNYPAYNYPAAPTYIKT